MKENLIFSYQNEEIQRKTSFVFLESLQSITNTQITDLKKIANYSIRDLIDISISVFDYLLCDEMRVQVPPFPVWTDTAAIYYRSDSQKMDLIRKILEDEGLNIENFYTYLGPNVHIEEYFKIYGGKIVEFTPKYSVLIIKKDCKPEPILGVPRQDVFAELIMCGINPFGKEKVVVSEERKKVSLEEIAKSESSDSINQKMFKMAQKYADLYDSRVNLLPMTSGTAANELAIRHLSLDNKNSVYIHPFWYYENTPSVMRLFKGRVIQDIEEANVYLINLEPTNFLNLDYKNKIITPEELLRKIVSLASRNKNKSYYILVDNTVDPFGYIYILKDLISMSNVYVITAMSLSKHQNGSRKYFFGLIGLYGNSVNLRSKLEKNIVSVNGRLSTFNSKAFPSLDPEKIQSRVSYIRDLNNWIEKNFQNDYFFPVGLTFNTVIFPNISPTCYHDLNWVEYNNSMEILVKSIVQNFNNPKFEYGDSFGLGPTRIVVQGDYKNFHLPRISPGFNCTVDDLEKFVKYLEKELYNFKYLSDVYK